MCGITGVMHFNSKNVDKDMLVRMTSSMIHRGPDSGATYIDENVGFGHRRLAIIDIETGEQPMSNEAGTLTIVYNGEIYNYIELRRELMSRGYVFRTDSDTEVVLHSYNEWGDECQDKFNGMWAFAIWDRKNRRLFLSRDRVGEKPLYYSIYNGTFYFGSEAKSILQANVPDEMNHELLEVYLTFGYIPAPYSFYKCIKKLPSGCCLSVQNGMVREKRYWMLPQVPEQEMRTDKNQIFEEFKYLIEDSVRLRMRSDVPFGAFLSGGMDSASIVSLMSEMSEHPIETFTIGFDEKIYDERPLARLVAQKNHTNHHEFIVRKESFEESLSFTLHHYDEPFGDSSAIPTGYVSKDASRHVKMVLTGDGGDEVLSGYKAYGGEKIASLYQKIPSAVRCRVPGSLNTIGGIIPGELRYKINRTAGFFAASNLPFMDRLLYKSAWLPPVRIKNIFGDCGSQISPRDYLEEIFQVCSFKDPFYKLMFFQFYVSLPERMLTKVDRMTMAHSLEARVPFLDFRLVEMMSAVSKKIKMPGLDRKAVLKKAMGKNLPPELFKAPKKGFRIPLREWFKDDAFKGMLSNIKFRELGLNDKTINEIIDENRKGKKDYGNFIWMLFLLDRWLTCRP